MLAIFRVHDAAIAGHQEGVWLQYALMQVSLYVFTFDACTSAFAYVRQIGAKTKAGLPLLREVAG